eukprot:CAMPEP_0118644396 /NCGR_PEP_ID=MMETSP0785-20121206/6923_1 /TAXON_ID=91992 /ORGANISM="Bolidomonas pacifica, Strain CCMP 1866" /LENGTH=45 /DNA_ID= /DNA_START= /DNA_END= /DNA_ORIENTATION=
MQPHGRSCVSTSEREHIPQDASTAEGGGKLLLPQPLGSVMLVLVG